MNHVAADNAVEVRGLFFDLSDDIRRKNLAVAGPKHRTALLELVGVDHISLGTDFDSLVRDGAVCSELCDPDGLDLVVVSERAFGRGI